MLQLILHGWGDYILQSDWMAQNKSQRSWPCLVHCTLYTLPFLLITQSPVALAVIFGTHFLIDRFGLARYLVWIKNHMAPRRKYCVSVLINEEPTGFIIMPESKPYPPWEVCRGTGYHDEIGQNLFKKEVSDFRVRYEFKPVEKVRVYENPLDYPDKNLPPKPVWMSVWLLIITDNVLHLTCNYIALTYL